MSTRIPPTSSPIAPSQISNTSPSKQILSPKNQQITKLVINSLSKETAEDAPSLEEGKINQEPPEDEDFSLLFQDILSVTDDLATEFEEEGKTLSSVDDSDEGISEFIQENVSELENEQEVETKETSSLVTAFAKQEVFVNVETVAKRAETSLGEIHALTDLMMKDKAKVIENTTITVRHKNLSVLKFVKDATPQELRNAKPEDFGLVVGDRHLRHPNFKFKPGDVSVLHINGQPVQLRMEHMRQDQADKFQTIYKEHITQVLGNQPVDEKKDDQKLVKDGSFASHLQPKDLRLKLAPEKKQVVSGAPAGPSQSEIDEHAQEAADLLKAQKEEDESASARLKKVELKEREHKEIQNEKSTDNDTTLTIQAPGSLQRKPDVLQEKTVKKHKELKN